MLEIPYNVTLTCSAPVSDGHRAVTSIRQTWNGNSYTKNITIKINPDDMGSSDRYLLTAMLHEIGHARFLSASEAQQKKAAAVLGVDLDGWAAGSYKSQPQERAAQAAPVYLLGTDWLGFTPISRDQFNRIYAALD